jgi:hypothetical protein
MKQSGDPWGLSGLFPLLGILVAKGVIGLRL